MAFVLLSAAGGAYGLYFHTALPRRLPTETDWKATAALLARDAKPGDAVALAPMWAERARIALPASLPILALPGYAGEDLIGIRRLWVLSLPNAPGTTARRIEAEVGARAKAVEGPQELGALRLTRYDLTEPLRPLAWLPDRLAQAKVTLGEARCEREDAARPLRRMARVRAGTAPRSQGFRCPGGAWMRVAPEIREIDELPRSCIYAHPGPDPRAPLTIEFPGVPMGGVLRGHVGIIGEQALGGRSRVRMTIKVDGHFLGLVEEPPPDVAIGTPDWRPFRFPTDDHQGKEHTLAFQIAADDATARSFCFEAMTL
jgi:hypothetical protein